MAFDLLNPQISKVTRSTENLVFTCYGGNGNGKSAGTVRAEKPLYLAFGKSGLSGINNIPFIPINSWSEFRQFVKSLTNKNDSEKLHDAYKLIILDELEILWKLCTSYVCAQNNVTKIGDANNGYGAWGDLKDEWESQILKLIGSGFCIAFILHETKDDKGKAYPAGDTKRFLPVLINHSDVVGYVKNNGVDPNTGRPIHSSLMLAETDEYFARTRNEYFDPCVVDYTFPNFVQAYYDALDRQEAAEGTKTITKEENDKLYETEKLDFDNIMEEVQQYGLKLHEAGHDEKLTEIVEETLGVGKKVSECTKRQVEAVAVILDDLKTACNELGL